MTADLPIAAVLPDALLALRRVRCLALEAPPGAGKTTRVPPALLEAGLAGDGQVLVLEPRRLATRMAARRVAAERGEEVGATVGYQVRFEEVAGPRTRIRFVTEGVLTRRLISERHLDGIGAVVLDEFHERHLQGDLALALLHRLQSTTRPDLRLVVMSATLDAEPVVRFLGDCTVLRSSGQCFAVDVEHDTAADERPLEARVAAAVGRLLGAGPDGDVLVFLPGAAEIGRARTALADLATRHDLFVVTLHGDLSAEEQDRALRPASKRKVILSTNVAETSVTVEGVTAVVDSGLARVAGHSPWSGLPTLRLAKISRASAAQRAGRAGRTRPGRCLRLYTRHDHDSRPAHDTPEIRRLDLADTALMLHGAGVRDLSAFAWLEPPPEAALAAAEALLVRLGAVDSAGSLTPTGARMLRFPVHPRLARMLVFAEERGVAAEAAAIAAALGERDLRTTESRGASACASGSSDLLEVVELADEAARAGFDAARLRALGVEPGAARAVDRARRQLMRACARSPRPGDAARTEAAVGMAVLAGFPDRVARRRRPGSPELLLAAGGTAELSRSSVVREAALLVAVDAEEQLGGTARRVRVRAASAIWPEWLLDLHAGSLHEERQVEWNPAGERVEVVARLRYDELVLDEHRGPPTASDREPAMHALAQAALADGLAVVDQAAVNRWRARTAFVAGAFPEAGLSPCADAGIRAALIELCDGLSTFAELRRVSLVEALRARLPPAHARLVAEMAPERVALPSGRIVRVEYEAGKPPWVASRLQDFFGAEAGPTVAGGRVPLVLHLLAPNQRPVQVTTDLSGFWARHYPGVRRELSRRYPRHAWPEEPRSKAVR